LSDKALERVLKAMLEEKSLIKLLRDLEKDELFYKENQINVKDCRMVFEKININHFYN
jgi:hypothetical protein